MRLIPVDEIQAGMVLGKSVFEKDNRLLLGAGFHLTPTILPKLHQKGLSYIYIMEEGTEEVVPEDIISTEVKMQASAILEDKAKKIEKQLMFQDLTREKFESLLKTGYLKDIDISSDMKNVVEEIFKDIASSGTNLLSTMILKSKKLYNMDHAINCSILSILIGKNYGFSKPELIELAMGTLLHDFGKIVLEKLKNSKNAKLAEELMKEHPTYGYLLVRNTKCASPIVSQIIRQHHENQNGTGYPNAMRGENLPPIKSTLRKTNGCIYRLAEICSVVNAFDNLLMNPLDKEKKTPYEALKHLISQAGSVYNKEIVKMLLKITPLYPVGTKVKITNFFDPTYIGYSGVVGKINKDKISKPTIILLYDRLNKKMPPKRIDTSKLKNIEFQLMV